MAAKYGNTWWGEQWLRSLSNIDFSNRLPRGRRYANNGSVVSIDFNGNKIKADVQGTRPKPYKIKIQVPEFTQEQKRELMSAIVDNPLILSKLLNRELPMPLHEIALEKKIRIFPQSWTDLDMKCSCPDWAVPCKHLAAVIYTIGNEIDRNPFIIFQLHGLDILSELAKRGFQSGETGIHIKRLTENEVERNEEDWDPLSEDFSGIDFSKIPDLHDNLMAMLNDQCLFYNGDLKKRLNTANKKVKKTVESFIEKHIPTEETEENYGWIQEFSVCITGRLKHNFTSLYSRNSSIVFEQGEFPELLSYLEKIPHKKIANLPHNLRQLHTIYTFAKKLLLQGAYVPELIKNRRGEYILRWVPALMNEYVKYIFDKLTQTMPGNAVHIFEYEEESFYNRNEQLTLFISQCMSFFMHKAARDFIKSNDTIERFFFLQIPREFEAFGEEEIPQTIQRW
ncbi:MAG: SWIM zinc finger family protein, partial [Salinivirgaceae bacterium]